MGVKIFVVGASLTIVAAMAIALAIYFRVIPVPMYLLGMFARTRQTEFSARYYPQDTVAYTWITLMPRGRQMRYVREIWQQFNEYPGFVDTVDDWKSEFSEETGISFDDDVAPWIGPTLSAGILDAETDVRLSRAAALIGVRDEDAASDFLVMWIDYVSTKWGVDFESGTYLENPTWVAGGDDHAYALTGDWLVYATDQDSLHGILDRVEGAAQESLAGSAKFREAREALPEPRFASAYVDRKRGAEILEAWGSPFRPISPLTAPAQGQEENHQWLAFAAQWIDRGLVTEWVKPAAAATGLQVADLEDPAGLLPPDTLGFVAARFDPDVDNWRVALADRRLSEALPGADPAQGSGGMLPGLGGTDDPRLTGDSSLAEVLDLGLELGREMTGIDLETEFFDHLAGTAILAAQDFDIAAVRDDPTGHAVDAVAMLSYEEDSRDHLDATMNRMAELARSQAGMSTEQVDVGAESQATVFGLGPPGMLMDGEPSYRPGYVLHDQYLTVGTTPHALATAVALQNGQGENLSANAEYRRAVQYLPAARQVLGYLNARRIVDQLDGEDLGLEADEYDVLRDGVGVLAFGWDVGESHSRGVAVVTFFPQ